VEYQYFSYRPNWIALLYHWQAIQLNLTDAKALGQWLYNRASRWKMCKHANAAKSRRLALAYIVDLVRGMKEIALGQPWYRCASTAD